MSSSHANGTSSSSPLAVKRGDRGGAASKDDESQEEGEVSPSDNGHSAYNNQHYGQNSKFVMTPPASLAETSRQDHKRKRSTPRSHSDTTSSAYPPGDRWDHVGVVETQGPRSRDTDDFATSKRVKIDGPGDARHGLTGARGIGSSPRRLPDDLSMLAPQVWQFIFTYLPPETLVALTRVNKTFHSLLVPRAGQETPSLAGSDKGKLEVVPADHIWACARRNNFPDIPRPLHGRPELEMWRLVRGTGCQFCGKQDLSEKNAPSVNLWDPPLKAGGVKIVWPFGVRSCGACLVDHSEEETKLHMSSSMPIALLSALPFTFFTPELHVITPSALPNAVKDPNLQVKKYFLKSHIEDIKSQLQDVKTLGPAAAEEWFKGLECQGKERLSDSSRWERWESLGGLMKLRSDKRIGLQALPPKPVLMLPETRSSASERDIPPRPATASRSRSPNPRVLQDSRLHLPASMRSTPLSAPPRAATGPPTRIAMSPGQSGYQGLQGPFNPPRPERTMREVTELKAARRAEIERRCSELDPPIPPRILQHMDSFQAAMQMSMALTDSQWELLRPRLLDQRDMAERSEKDEAAQRAHLLGEGEERHRREAAEKEDKEAQEKAWDDVQRPIRDLLAVYADEIIRDRWSRGETLSKDTSPKFASDVLIYARRRFYADMANGDEDRKRVGRSVDDGSPSAPATRKLNLENMKWLFDTKIKPLTEQYRKELFLCHTCEHPSKFYGFEGVVQHFAAKHTNELSHGSIVVHWKAEWPEFPPFHPDPSAAKAAFHAAANPPGVGAVPSVSGYNHGAFPHGPGSARFSQYSPAPFNHPNFAEQHPRHQNGMFAPPPPYQGPSQAFSAGAHYQGNPNGYHGPNPGYAGTVPGYDGYSMQYQPQAALGYGSPHPGPIYPVPVQGSPQMAPQVFGHHPGHFGLNPGLAHPLSHAYPHPSPMMGHAQPNPHMSAPTGSMYQTQLEEMAASARDVWSNTSGIKDLPGSVRAHIVIHQTVARFKAKFPNEPSLAMFIEGLASHSRMKPVNNLNGLICKACQPGGEAPGTGFQSHPPRFPAGDKKLYTLPALLNHFKAVHLEQHASGPNMPGIGGTPPRMDWKTDMVELPAQSAIAALLHAPGLDDGKLKLIAEVFPKAFPWPLPTLDSENSTGPVPVMHGPEGPEYRGIKVQVPDYVGPSKGRPIDHRVVSAADPSRERRRPRSRSPESLHPAARDKRAFHGEQPLARGPTPESAGPRHELRDPGRYDDGLRSYGPEPPRRHDDAGRPDRPGERRFPPPADGRPSEADGPAIKSRPKTLSTPESSLRHPHEYHAASGGREYSVELHRPSRSGLEQTHHRPTHDRGLSLRSPGPHDTTLVSKKGVSDGPEDRQGGGNSLKAKRSADQGFAPSEETSAAVDRFFNEVLPADDAETSKRSTMEYDPWTQPELRGRMDGGHEHVAKERQAADDASERPVPRDDANEARAESTTLQASPTDAGKHASRAGDPRISAHAGDIRQAYEARRTDAMVRSPVQAARPVIPTPDIDARRTPATMMYHAADNPRRPRSRFERYESLAQERYRGRSRSPVRASMPRGQELRYRDESPSGRQRRYEPIFRSRSPGLVRPGAFPAEERRYATASSQDRYLAWANEPVYAEHYGPRMEYVTVPRGSARSPPPPPPSQQSGYVLAASASREVPVGYARYDDELHGGQFYEDRGQFYRVEKPVYRADDRHSQGPPYFRY